MLPTFWYRLRWIWVSEKTGSKPIDMARIMAFDYGIRRVGIATTDPEQRISTAIGSFPVQELFPFLQEYLRTEKVEGFVVGYPKTLQNLPSESLGIVTAFIDQLRKKFPEIPVYPYDERFTSKMAFQTMIDGGLGKKARRNKSMIDQVSAVIILQDFMEWRENQLRNGSPGS